MSRSTTSTAAFALTTAVAAGAMVARRYMSLVPPRARRMVPPHKVLFGVVEGQPPSSDAHGPRFDPPIVREDPLFWLRDDKRKDPEILAHLEKENTYTAAMTKDLLPLRDAIYEEFIGRTQETSMGFPYAWGGEGGSEEWHYYRRNVKGLSYSIIARVPAAKAASAQAAANAVSDKPVVPEGELVLLDINELAKGKKHCDVGSWVPSPSHRLLAYSIDYTGNETYDIVVMRLGGASGAHEYLADRITGTSGGVVWGGDDSELYYVTLDDAHRPHKIWRHRIGSAQSEDECLLTEDDERFNLRVRKSDSGSHLVAASKSKISAECSLLDIRPAAAGGAGGAGGSTSRTFKVVQPRVPDMLYSVEPHPEEGLLFIVTNAGGAKNFKVCTVALDGSAAQGVEHWADVVPHRPAVKVDAVEVFSTFLALHGREGGFPAIWILPIDATRSPPKPRPDGSPGIPSMTRLPSPEPVYLISGSVNMQYRARVLRYCYESPTTPPSWYEWDVSAARPKLLKRSHVPNYDPSLYRTIRGSVAADDGVEVPVSIVFRPDVHGLNPDDVGPSAADYVAAASAAATATGGGSGADTKPASGLPRGLLPKAAPTLVYGYGSYGYSMDGWFSKTVPSLLDRGIVYAVAHVRGGGEMGRHWYEDQGKLLTKRNTFTDFIACTEGLVAAGWTDRSRIAAMGASAGGLLMGAIVNMRPDLWRAIVAKVPFVDVMTTMSDTSIPLTTTEFEEWGDVRTPKFHDYILSYSPVDNVRPGTRYPRVLATAGLWDSRVAYWEPAKWVALLRDATTSGEPILFKCDTGAGHFSASDRYRHLHEYSFEVAFVCDALGAKERVPPPSSGAGSAASRL